MGVPRRCAVLGSPVAHSLSPVLHRTAYAELGLDWDYQAKEVTEGELAGFLDSLDGSWRGLSLTMPLKRAVLPLLDEVTPRARLAGAANTVVLDGGRRRGDNTDIPGAVAALGEHLEGAPERALVLGGGATAASVLHALAELGCPAAVLAARRPERAAETVEAVRRHPRAPVLEVVRLGEGPARTVDVLVSTVPAAVQDAWVLAAAERAALVFDVVYDPWPTPLAVRTLDAGRPLVGGLDLLVHQAALQVELMTGRRAPLEAMRAAGERALASRSGG